MTKFIGQLADFGIAKETVRGTPESTATFWIPKMTLTLDDTIEQAIDENSIGVIEDATDAKVVHKVAVGEVEGKISDKSIGLFLLSLLGTVSTSGPSDSAYTHTFSVAQSAQHQALSLFVDDGNQDYKYALGMVTSMDISAEVGQIIQFKAGLRSKIGATATLTPSYSAENLFLAQHVTFKIAATQAGLDAASATNIRSISLTIDSNVEDDRALGSVAPVDILNKHFMIEGEMELVFDDEAIKTAMLADTVKALRIDIVNSDVLIGSSSTPALRFDLHSVKFSEFARNYDNTEIVTASVKFKAFYKLADSKMVTCRLINAQSSY